MQLEYIVRQEDNGRLLKYVLKSSMNISTRLLNKLKAQNKIYKNGVAVKVIEKVQEGDLIRVLLELEEENEDIVPQDIPLNILFEDECLLVIDKQPDIVVHPTVYHPDGTIANGIVHYLRKQGVIKKVRPVSRLDRDTTGVIIFAKNQYAQEMLIQQMQQGHFEKHYIGVVHGIPRGKYGTIDLPIDRKPGSIMERHISHTGARAVTHFEVEKTFPNHNAAMLKFQLETGRTHQIRVHSKAIGHPLFGDTLYSDICDTLISRQALHSNVTRIIHPVTRKDLEFIAPCPEDIMKLLEILSQNM